MGDKEISEKLKPLTCLDVLRICCKKAKRKLGIALCKVNKDYLEHSWISLPPAIMLQVLEASGEKMFCIVKGRRERNKKMKKKKKNKKKNGLTLETPAATAQEAKASKTGSGAVALATAGCNLVLDGTRLPVNYHLKTPTRYWYFKPNGSLIGIYRRPRFEYRERQLPAGLPSESDLREALKFYPAIASKLGSLPHYYSPQDHTQLQKVFCQSNIGNVVVKLVVSWKKFTTVDWNMLEWPGACGGPLVTLYAYRNHLDKIQYTLLKDEYTSTPSVPQNKEELKNVADPPSGGAGALPPPAEPANMHFYPSGTGPFCNTPSNRRASMSLTENGLNLALRLGAISESEFSYYNPLMACLHGFLIFKVVNCNTIRHVSYMDHECSRVFEIYTDDDWCKLFSFLVNRTDRMLSLRKELVENLLCKLRPHHDNPVNSKFKTCYNHFVHFSTKNKILMYDTDDTCLHLLKIPMANYFHSIDKRKFTSVWMKCSSKNLLSSLSYKHLQIENLGPIFSLEHHTNVESDFSTFWKGMEEWNPFYSSSPQQELPPPYTENPVEHCLELVRCLYNGYQNFSQYLLLNFQFDIHSLRYLNLPVLSNSLFWHTYLRLSPYKFLCHPVEKSLPSNDEILRQYCHGGFTLSAEREFVAGQAMRPDLFPGELANSIYGLDLTSSYGNAAKRIYCPGGFGSTWKFDKRQETSQRYKFFEFRAVFYTIYKYQLLLETSEDYRNKTLVGAYHNYSPLGIFCVGKYPIDLVLTFSDGSVHLYQFDGNYVHGCANPLCKTLPSYVEGRSREECIQKTLQRNYDIFQWIGEDNKDVLLFCIQDCCCPEYSSANLKLYFRTIPGLRNLITGYDEINGDIQNVTSRDLTFLAVADVECFLISPPLVCSTGGAAEHSSLNLANGFPGPLVLDSKTLSWSGKVLLTRDYLDYLKDHFRVTIRNSPEIAIFYKVDKIFPLVYEHFLSMRNFKSKAISTFYKSILNMSCGFFGSNSENRPVKYIRFTSTVPRYYSPQLHSIILVPDLDNQDYSYATEKSTFHKNFNCLFVVKTYSTPLQQAGKKSGRHSLPIFISIIEYGKLKLVEMFWFLHNHLPMEKFIVAYSHVDSCSIILSTPTIQEASGDPVLFETIWNQYFFSDSGGGKKGNEKKPGFFHLEYYYDGRSTPWKFVTPGLCTWSLLKLDEKDNIAIFKMPGISQKTRGDIYNRQLDLLKKGATTISTHRRINKLGGIQKTQVDFHMTKKNKKNTNK